MLSVRDVVAFWPMGVAGGTHGYLDHTLRAGAVTDARAHIDIRPSDTVSGPLRNDAINVTFNVSGGQMQFLDTMSPVTNTFSHQNKDRRATLFVTGGLVSE